MKRWCFDNKNKKNNFYTQRIQSFFYFFSNHFFLFLFLNFIFQTSQFFFLLHASPWGNFYALSWFFYAHPHAYTPAFFAPHFKNTRFTSSLPFSNCQTIQTIQNFQTIHTSPVQFWNFRTFQNVYLYISRFYHQQIVRIFIIFLN